MSHFSVLVIGPDIERQLAPYQENNMGDCPKEYLVFNEDEDCDPDEETGKKGYWTNPNSKWDYYRIGGRWAGHFKLKEGATAPAPAPGYEVAFGQEQPEDNTADVVLKGDVDFAGMRDDAAAEAAKRYDFAMSFLGPLKRNLTWAEVRDAHNNDHDKARESYWAQARCKAWKTVERKQMEAHGLDSFFSNPDAFLVSRQQYIQKARDSAFSTFAVVMNGKWYEKGEMGWWAIVTNEKDEETWLSMFAKMIDGLSDDTQLTVIDCRV